MKMKTEGSVVIFFYEENGAEVVMTVPPSKINGNSGEGDEHVEMELNRLVAEDVNSAFCGAEFRQPGVGDRQAWRGGLVRSWRWEWVECDLTMGGLKI